MKNINIVLGCLHAPFHSKTLWYGVLKLVKDLQPHLQGIYLIGDILDLNSFSGHESGKYPLEINGESLNIRDEYKMIKIFDELDEIKVEKKFIYGNHEDRYIRQSKIPDNDKIMADSPENYFRLRERGYEVKTRWKEDYFKLGDHLEAFHGELLGVNPAKRQLDKLKKSCMFAHSHRAGVHYDGNMAAYNIGWLGDVESPAFSYAGRLTKRNWVNGFGLVTIDNNGDYFANVITAYNDRFFYNGKKYGK